MRLLVTVLAAHALCAVMSASAITKEEWQGNPSLIPTPTSESAFYIAKGPVYAGGQSADAVMSGFDTVSAERIYDFSFETDFRTYLPGTMLIIR
jgi:hypothetical protein